MEGLNRSRLCNYIFIYCYVNDSRVGEIFVKGIKDPNAHNVYFDSNGGYAMMSSQKHVTGGYTLPENAFGAPTGKQFKCWATKKDGSGSTYQPGETVTLTSDTTFYAIWQDIPGAPSIPSGGGSASQYGNFQKSTKTESFDRSEYGNFILGLPSVSVNSPYKESDFEYRWSSGNKNVVGFESASAPSATATTGINDNGARLYLTGNGTATVTVDLYYKGSFVERLHTITYKVTGNAVGVAVSIDGGKTEFKSGETVSLTASGSQYGYTWQVLKFLSTGGATNGGNVKAQANDQSKVTWTAPTVTEKTTFRFVCMPLNSSKWPLDEYTQMVDITVLPSSATIAYDANGGTGTMKSQTITALGTYNLPKSCTFTAPAGKQFKGWSTSPDGKIITEYKFDKPDTTTTFYAIWGEPTKCTVSFDSDGGSSVSSITVITGEPYGTLPIPTRQGYTFDGWYTAKTGGSKVTDSTKVTATGDHTLYARWVLGDGKLTVSPSQLIFDTVKEGYSQPAAQTVTIKNTGSNTVTLSRPSSSSNFIIGSLSRTTLSAGSSATFTVRPQRGLKAGTYNETITVKTSDGKAEAKVTVYFTVQSSTSITASPTSIDFGKLQEDYDQPAARTVTIRNTGSSYVSLRQPSSSSNFDIGILSRTTFSAGSSATFTVRPKTGLKAGTYNETITVRTSDGKAEAQITVYFTVQGNISITASPTSLSFGTVKEGYEQPAAQTVTVKNISGSTVTLSQPSSSNFIIGSLSRTSLSSGSSVTFTVQPKAGLKAGAHNETITVKTSDGKASASLTVSFVVEAETPAIPPSSFTDVYSSAYYYDAVLWAVENGITSGTSETTFSPDKTCTRGQVVTFLWRAIDRPEITASASSFTDVSPSAYCYDAVLWAVENGVTAGTSSSIFSPEDTCTRGQVVTFLWRAAGQPEPTASASPFTDVQDTGAYYYKAVLWAVENGITTGTSETEFSPDSTCTRAQVVMLLHRAYQ